MLLKSLTGLITAGFTQFYIVLVDYNIIPTIYCDSNKDDWSNLTVESLTNEINKLSNKKIKGLYRIEKYKQNKYYAWVKEIKNNKDNYYPIEKAKKTAYKLAEYKINVLEEKCIKELNEKGRWHPPGSTNDEADSDD